jgi:hypothetical protein
MGKKVLAVEPFLPNILRLHKAAKMAYVDHMITLVQNGLSDKRNEIVQLTPVNTNIGAQGISSIKPDLNNTKSINVDYLLETILFDDLLEYLPKKANGKKFRRAVIKIDIESYEVFAFVHARKFFELYKVQAILMEWAMLSKHPPNVHPLIENMLDLFDLHKLEAHTINGGKLDRKAWNTWPENIAFFRTKDV